MLLRSYTVVLFLLPPIWPRGLINEGPDLSLST